MKFRATATPRATAAPVLPPMPAAPATARTSASTTPVDSAGGGTAFTGAGGVPSAPPITRARVDERITLVDSEPPPANAMPVVPETATESATAIDLTVMCASFVALIATLPARIVPASYTNASTALSIELCASD